MSQAFKWPRGWPNFIPVEVSDKTPHKRSLFENPTLGALKYLKEETGNRAGFRFNFDQFLYVFLWAQPRNGNKGPLPFCFAHAK